MKCEECDFSEAEVLCKDCDQCLCTSCDEFIHRGGKRKTHTRPAVCHNCKTFASINCSDCSQSCCSTCEFFHNSHSTKPLQSVKRLGVFWDLSSIRPNRSEDILTLINEIESLIGRAEVFKSYGDTWAKWKDFLSINGISSVQKPGVKAFEALLVDISLIPSTGLSDILVISGQSSSILPHLRQLKYNFPTVNIYVSHCILPLQIKEVSLEQPRKEKPFYVDIIIAYLKEQAFTGNIIIESSELAKALSLRSGSDLDEVNRMIDQGEAGRALFISFKEFDRIRTKFVSLKIDTCSLEVLTWTLRSLCSDEMLPSEKAIQARMREVFDLKPSPSEWQGLMAQARGHSHSSSTPEFSLFSWSPSLPKFVFERIYEQSSGTHTVLIYPAGEKWHALDNDSKSGDYLKVKTTNDWKDLLKFLEDYFKPKGKGKKEPDQKTIPGGRYGCAQFIKILGPVSLRKCSLGRLSYMVQLAINDNILKYDRTLILWTSNTQCSLPRDEISKKLLILKTSIIGILEKYQEGVSLAQLPMHLKKCVKFSYNLNDLGFAKLKDLLVTIPEVSIELRNANHPFAVLNRGLNIETIINCILTGIGKSGSAEIWKLESHLIEKIGLIDWKAFKVASLSEFIQNYAGDKVSVFHTQVRLHDYLFYKPDRGDSWDITNTNDRSYSPEISHKNTISIESYEPWYNRVFDIPQYEDLSPELYDRVDHEFTYEPKLKNNRNAFSRNFSQDFSMSHFHGHHGSWFDYSSKPPGFD